MRDLAEIQSGTGPEKKASPSHTLNPGKRPRIDTAGAHNGLAGITAEEQSPFTSVASASFSAEQNPEDLNFGETVLMSQLEATSVVLAAVSEAIVEFLGEAD